ncbi:MAG: hypothetical protein CBC35_12055 [Planctomycetes bacterium TMED75]|nr:MAG: hypothetical protein CBC35_12055 [Planctomycetes bacterium TMED75]
MFGRVQRFPRASRVPGPLGGVLAGLLLSVSAGAAGTAGICAQPRVAARLDVLDQTPHAVQGRPIAIPIRLNPEQLQQIPPDTVELRLDDGTSTTALVAWLATKESTRPSPLVASWTAATAPLKVVPFPDAPALRSTARGVLLATLAEGYSGALRLGDQLITPRWVMPANPSSGSLLPARTGPGWPPLDEPGGWWRWALLADSLGQIPPEPSGGPRSKLVARSIAALWRAGLDRVARESPGAADELRDLLVSQCRTARGIPVACWITNTDELNSILSLLLDSNRPVGLTVRSLLFYLDARFPLLAWPVSSPGARIRIALANPTDAEQVVRIQWVEDDPVPVAAVVPPGRIQQIEVDRPVHAGTHSGRLASAETVLVLTCGGIQDRMQLPSEFLVVRPPGLQFGPFLAPMTLAQAWDGAVLETDPRWATSAVLRKRRGQWELFVECLSGGRPALPQDGLEVHLGLPNAPIRLIRIAPDGSLSFAPGGGGLRGAEASTTLFPDRWRAILRLDSSLIESAAAPGMPQTLLIGIRRVLGDDVIGVADGSVPVWNPLTPVFLVELSDWGDISSTSNRSAP